MNGELESSLTYHTGGSNMARSLLDRPISSPAIAALGNTVERTDIRSSLGPFKVFPHYKITYPEVVIDALGNLYDEYNTAFAPLVVANREWKTDYTYCMPDGVPINWCVQIDMVGLPDAFLQQTAGMSEEAAREILRHEIFEIENSIAMYQLLENFFSRNGQDSFFKTRFRAVLNDLRQRFGRPIALLAVTDEKYHAMMASEFGNGYGLSDAEILDLSGFDRFFSPGEFRRHVEGNGGECKYLLYARTSDPVSKLRNPGSLVMHPLLGNSEMRRIIKQCAITFNVDNPVWPIGDSQRINDTKEYMRPMRMAFQIATMEGLRSPEFQTYLHTQGLKPALVKLRCKPAKGTYGCYGHVAGVSIDGKKALARGLKDWGDYVVQPEMPTPVITNATNGTAYTFIDRNFFGMVDGRPVFLGGVRTLMPMDTTEAREGRIHGNSSTVYAEIVCEIV
ncbi:MAG: hypothetical protein AAB932_01550 [Patescibacteria group bacterium]